MEKRVYICEICEDPNHVEDMVFFIMNEEYHQLCAIDFKYHADKADYILQMPNGKERS